MIPDRRDPTEDVLEAVVQLFHLGKKLNTKNLCFMLSWP